MRVVKRDWILSDFLLFSEKSLNYVREVEFSAPRDKQTGPNQRRTPAPKIAGRSMRQIGNVSFNPVQPDQADLLARFEQELETKQREQRGISDMSSV